MVWRVILWFFLVLVAVLLLALLMPVGIRVRYRQEKMQLWYSIGPLRIRHHAKDPKERNTKKDSKANIRKMFSESIHANRKYDGVLGEFLAELKTVLGLFWKLCPKLRVKRLVLKLHIAGENPATVALQYGGAWTAIGGLLPVLEEAFVLKRHELDVDCNFSGGKTTLDAELDISIGLGRLLLCLIRYLMPALEQPNNMNTERRL